MKKLSFTERILARIAGADIQILARQNHRGDRVKFAAMGFGLIIKTTFATVSGAFALSTVFTSPLVAILGGSLWGCAMFNLDKNLIVTSRKEKQGDLFREVPIVLIKLSIAALTGYIVAVPLQLRVFQDAIESRIAIDQAQAQIEANKTVSEAFPEIDRLRDQKSDLEATLRSKAKEVEQAYIAKVEEAEGISGSGVRGKGITYKDKKEWYELKQGEYALLEPQVQSRIQEINQQLSILEDQRDQQINELNKAQDVSDLLTQLKTLQKLSEEYPSVGYARLLLSLLFIGVDISPVLAKTLAKRSPYDAELEKIEKGEIKKSETELLNTRDLLEGKRGVQNKLFNEALNGCIGSEKFVKITEEIADEALDWMAASVREVVSQVKLTNSQIENAVKEAQENALKDIAQDEVNAELYKRRINHLTKEITDALNQYANERN